MESADVLDPTVAIFEADHLSSSLEKIAATFLRALIRWWFRPTSDSGASASLMRRRSAGRLERFQAHPTQQWRWRATGPAWRERVRARSITHCASSCRWSRCTPKHQIIESAFPRQRRSCMPRFPTQHCALAATLLPPAFNSAVPVLPNRSLVVASATRSCRDDNCFDTKVNQHLLVCKC